VSRHIPESIRCMLWGRTAGRCSFCNKPVSWNTYTKETVNLSEAAHIIGFSNEGPRGEHELSEELAQDITNLMLLCRDCHKTIDTNKTNYPVNLLRKMKADHENRIELVAGISTNKQSHILLYGANVGDHSAPLSYQKTAPALFPEWLPAEKNAISLGMVNSSFRDRNKDFWKIEETHLREMSTQQVRPRLRNGSIEHLSIFGFAPQPLLMLLGCLLSDIPAAETYQLHREPPDWKWQNHVENFSYNIDEPSHINGDPALILSLSDTINNDRIYSVLGSDISIWKISINNPHNDFLKSRQQLQNFREITRVLMGKIKAKHGEHACLHVFPAVPVAVAIDFGRIITPKASLPLKIYDENKSNGGFVHAIDINTRA